MNHTAPLAAPPDSRPVPRRTPSAWLRFRPNCSRQFYFPPAAFTIATIIFGSDDAEPLLGVTSLESVGIEVDPQNQRLKRLPAVRLKCAATR